MKRSQRRRLQQELEDVENEMMGRPHGLFSRHLEIRVKALVKATGWDIRRCRQLVREHSSVGLQQMVEAHQRFLGALHRQDRTFIGQTHGD